MTDGGVDIGVVGLGYWGPNLVRSLHDVTDARIAWVCDRNPIALDRIARRYPSLATTTDVDEVLDDASVDAVVIATPVSTHHDLAMAALRAEKHVLVEKPLAASLRESVELAEEARARQLILMPGHTFLYSPPVMLVHDLIASGELGDVYFVSSSRVNLGLHQRDVSVVWDLGPHDFSILRYWLDERPVSATAMGRECVVAGVPDVAFVSLEYPSGAIAHVELSWLAPSKLRRTTVVGSRKMLIYDDTSSEPVRVFDAGASVRDPRTFGEYRMTYRTGDIVSPRVQPVEPLYLELKDFCQAVQTGTGPRSDVQVGLDVVVTIEAAHQSLTGGGGPVAVQEPGVALDRGALR
jgi:predicted dehydrogenase